MNDLQGDVTSNKQVLQLSERCHCCKGCVIAVREVSQMSGRCHGCLGRCHICQGGVTRSEKSEKQCEEVTAVSEMSQTSRRFPGCQGCVIAYEEVSKGQHNVTFVWEIS